MNYQELISLGNLFQAWSEFRIGKRKRKDVQVFERNLEDNLFALYEQLKSKTYKHGNYKDFYVHDPKKRHIHKAEVVDRVIQHLLYKYLYGIFDKSFIFDSYSCRLEKGTHKGVLRLQQFVRKVSKNYKSSCWALKLDITKFFANIDHKILLQLLKRKVGDEDILGLLSEIIDSYHSESGADKGIPLGNLTSQIFANVYMDELDQFMKHKLKVRYYLRYADDFLTLFRYDTLVYHNELVSLVDHFLQDNLKLQLHPKKIILRNLNWGIDFLGYIVLPHYRLPRTKTKRRAFNKLKTRINSINFNQTLQSYLGFFSHANTYKMTQALKNQIWFWELPRYFTNLLFAFLTNFSSAL